VKDIGLTHIALQVTDLQNSCEFYSKYAAMEIVHERPGVIWISDKTRPFVIVLFESKTVEIIALGQSIHVICPSMCPE